MYEIYQKVWFIFEPFKKSLLKMIVALILMSICSVLLPYVFAGMIEAMTDGANMYCLLFIIGTTSIHIIEQITRYFRSMVETNEYSFELDEAISIFASRQYSRLSIGQYINRNSAYDQSLIMSGIFSLRDLIKIVLFEVSPNLLTMIVTMITLLFIATKLGLMILFAASLFLALLIVADRYLKTGLEIRNKLKHASAKNYSEIIRNIILVVTNNKVEESINDYRKNLNTYKIHAKNYWVSFIRWSTFRDLVLHFFLFLVLIIGVFYTDYSLSAKLAAFIVTDRILSGMKNLNRQYQYILEQKVAIKQFFDLLEIESDVKQVQNPVVIENLSGEINFQNVCFSHSEREEIFENKILAGIVEEKKIEVLKGINLKIKAGETIALIGASGSGKTTLVNLILRYFDPCRGEIFIDGHNLKNLNLGAYWEQVGIIPQHIEFFDNTINHNICFSSKVENGVSVEEALEMSHLLDFVSGLKQGVETRVGEKGITLSGGQRQRMAFAREFSKLPKIWILDEATSSLDLEIEARVFDSIREVSKGLTSIIVAHRLSTVKKIERIIVLDKGAIVGDGNFDFLSQNCSEFQRLVKHL